MLSNQSQISKEKTIEVLKVQINGVKWQIKKEVNTDKRAIAFNKKRG